MDMLSSKKRPPMQKSWVFADGLPIQCCKSITRRQVMIRSDFRAKCLIWAAAAALFAASPVFADKPSWAGGPHGGQHQKKDDRWQDRRDYSGRGLRDRDYRRGKPADGRSGPRYKVVNRPRYSGGRYFVDNHRTIVHNYYYEHYHGRRCPPGLAKKGNGCVPPGHARKWVIGRPLPREVIFYDVPQPLVLGLGYPPPGYRFVRVASDILLIAVGTGIVMDAIYDLGGGW
jgi:Ni/Co efflux regulator RcnB